MKYLIFTVLLVGSLHPIAAQDLRWAAQLGGTLADRATAIQIDDDGNMYVTGSYAGIADLDPGPGFTVFLSAGGEDVFLTKLDSEGNLLWGRGIGSNGMDRGEDVVIDDEGNIYLTGTFTGTVDFEPGPGFTPLTSFGKVDVFILKLDQDGQFVWARQIGGSENDHPHTIALDTAGNVLIGGHFSGTADFDPGAGAFALTAVGDSSDAFIVKLDTNGDLMWAMQFGDTGNDAVQAITIDADNTILITGHFSGIVDFDPGTEDFLLTSNGGHDIFISRLSAEADLLWAVSFGAEGQDEGTAMHTNLSGRVYTTGFFQGVVDFNPGSDTLNLTGNGAEDIFISVLDADGTFVMARQMGGVGTDKSTAIDTDEDGNIYTTGYFSAEADFDPDTTVFLLTSAGGYDVFVSKLAPDGSFLWTVPYGGEEDEYCLDMVIGDESLVYTAGYFSGVVDFDPGQDEYFLTSFGNTDAFVVVLEPCDPTFAEITETACDAYTSPDGLEIWTVSGTYVDTLVFGGCDSIITIQLTIINSTSAEIAETACDSYTSPDGLETWTESGTYMDTLVNTIGCDSIITVILTINNSTSSEIAEEACDRYISPDGLEIWTSSGTYTDTLSNAAGCDSVITVQLTIKNSTSSEIFVEICDSYVSPDGLETWTESGTYTDTLVNGIGCDSIVTVQLTIYNSTSSSILVDACESYLSPSGNYTWTESGIYLDTISSVFGCDSFMTIELTILENTSSTLDLTACDSFVSPSGQVWNSTGVYLDTIPNAAGCDSLLTINLTINSSAAGEITISACDSYSLPEGTQTWTESGVYQDTILNAVGCDSVVTVNLTINISPSFEITAEACDRYTSPTGAEIWTESGTYQEFIPVGGECDSIITVFLTINLSASVQVDVTACESYVSPDGTEIWTESGTYMDTIPTIAGCDSFIVVVLTIVDHTASEITVSACDSYSLPGGTQTWTESGVYQDTIPNALGCDSVVTVNLTINISPTAEIIVEACDTYTSPSGTQTWAESGTYIDVIPTGEECDSIVTIVLTILNSTTSEMDVTACDSYSSPDGTILWTESGIYLDTVLNNVGCDSVVTINLTIIASPNSSVTVEACDAYTLPGGAQTWTASGIYHEVFPGAGECDSMVTVNLTIHHSSTAELIASACDTYLSPSNNYQWTESGIYLDTIANAVGCDSVITIDLTIITIDTSVVQDEALLTAVMEGATYQWIDCNNGNISIDGETGQQFAAIATGQYAVIVSSGECSDTSSCYPVTIVSTDEPYIVSELKLYPNPTRDYFVIEPGRHIGEGVITVSDLQGREVYFAPYRGEERVEVQFEAASGVYVVTLTSGGYRFVGKVMVE